MSIFGDLYRDYVEELSRKRIFSKWSSKVGPCCDIIKTSNGMIRLSFKLLHKFRICAVFWFILHKDSKERIFFPYLNLHLSTKSVTGTPGSYLFENNSLLFGHVGLLTFCAVLCDSSISLINFIISMAFIPGLKFLKHWMLTAVLFPDVLSTKFKSGHQVVFLG